MNDVEPLFRCSHRNCNSKFTNFVGLRWHLRNDHNQTLVFTPFIFLFFEKKFTLFLFFRYRCRVARCQAVLSSATDLAIHERNEHSRSASASTSERCGVNEECEFVATSRTALSAHYREAHADDVHACEHCSEAFVQQSDLQRHELHSHQSEHNTLRCQFPSCGASFQHRLDLLQHMPVHLSLIHI